MDLLKIATAHLKLQRHLYALSLRPPGVLRRYACMGSQAARRGSSAAAMRAVAATTAIEATNGFQSQTLQSWAAMRLPARDEGNGDELGAQPARMPPGGGRHQGATGSRRSQRSRCSGCSRCTRIWGEAPPL